MDSSNNNAVVQCLRWKFFYFDDECHKVAKDALIKVIIDFNVGSNQNDDY